MGHRKLFNVGLVAVTWTLGITISLASAMLLERATIDYHTLIFLAVNVLTTCAALIVAASRPWRINSCATLS
jgi:hypothetical protein